VRINGGFCGGGVAGACGDFWWLLVIMFFAGFLL